MTSKRHKPAASKPKKTVPRKPKLSPVARHRLVIAAGVVLGLLAALIIYIAVVFGWYAWTNRGKPVKLGMSFSPNYARALGLDPREVYRATLEDLGIKRLRLNSYWNVIEPQKGKFDFSELDWQMDEAAAHGAKVNLAIGLRQPRWPECHPPQWVDTGQPWNTWKPDMEAFLTAVINRYKDHPALQSYQLENEIFNKLFGACNNHDKTRLKDEFNLAKRLARLEHVQA